MRTADQATASNANTPCLNAIARDGTPFYRMYEPTEPRIYRIIRFRFNGKPRTIRNNVTLTEAQAHCTRKDTHGVRAGVRWFDGYDYMRGCAPRSE